MLRQQFADTLLIGIGRACTVGSGVPSQEGESLASIGVGRQVLSDAVDEGLVSHGRARAVVGIEVNGIVETGEGFFGNGTFYATDGYRPAGAVIAGTDAVGSLSVSGELGDTCTDGDVAAGSVIAAADASRQSTSCSVDGATIDNDIAAGDIITRS